MMCVFCSCVFVLLSYFFAIFMLVPGKLRRTGGVEGRIYACAVLTDVRKCGRQ